MTPAGLMMAIYDLSHEKPPWWQFRRRREWQRLMDSLLEQFSR